MTLEEEIERLLRDEIISDQQSGGINTAPFYSSSSQPSGAQAAFAGMGSTSSNIQTSKQTEDPLQAFLDALTGNYNTYQQQIDDTRNRPNEDAYDEALFGGDIWVDDNMTGAGGVPVENNLDNIIGDLSNSGAMSAQRIAAEMGMPLYKDVDGQRLYLNTGFDYSDPDDPFLSVGSNAEGIGTYSIIPQDLNKPFIEGAAPIFEIGFSALLPGVISALTTSLGAANAASQASQLLNMAEMAGNASDAYSILKQAGQAGMIVADVINKATGAFDDVSDNNIVWQEPDVSDVLGDVQVQVPDYSVTPDPTEDDNNDGGGGGANASGSESGGSSSSDGDVEEVDVEPEGQQGGSEEFIYDPEHDYIYQGNGVFQQVDENGNPVGETYVREDYDPETDVYVVGDSYSGPNSSYEGPENTTTPPSDGDTQDVDGDGIPDIVWDAEFGDWVKYEPDPDGSSAGGDNAGNSNAGGSNTGSSDPSAGNTGGDAGFNTGNNSGDEGSNDGNTTGDDQDVDGNQGSNNGDNTGNGSGDGSGDGDGDGDGDGSGSGSGMGGILAPVLNRQETSEPVLADTNAFELGGPLDELMQQLGISASRQTRNADYAAAQEAELDMFLDEMLATQGNRTPDDIVDEILQMTGGV